MVKVIAQQLIYNSQCLGGGGEWEGRGGERMGSSPSSRYSAGTGISSSGSALSLPPSLLPSLPLCLSLPTRKVFTESGSRRPSHYGLNSRTTLASGWETPGQPSWASCLLVSREEDMLGALENSGPGRFNQSQCANIF